MKTTWTIIAGIAFTIVLTSCADKARTSYEIAYKNDKAGELVAGSKAALINAVRSGASVKIGWGSKGATRSIEHLSVPIWIGVLNEQEVIAHLDPQTLSRIDWDDLGADYAEKDSLNELWSVAITTKGTFDAVWYDRCSGEVLRRVPQNHSMTWFVDGSFDRALPFY